MGFEGPLYPGTTSGVGWTNPSNIAANDDADATVALGAGATSNYLIASNFGFAIPAGSKIDGVVQEHEGFYSGAEGVQNEWAQLYKAGVAHGTEKGPVLNGWTSSRATYTNGASGDVWGGTWTPDDINNSGFGSGIRCKAPAGADTANVDFMRLTVYYTPMGGAGVLAGLLFLRRISDRLAELLGLTWRAPRWRQRCQTRTVAAT